MCSCRQCTKRQNKQSKQTWIWGKGPFFCFQGCLQTYAIDILSHSFSYFFLNACMPELKLLKNEQICYTKEKDNMLCM
jgi:hypothetical protein